MGMMVHGVCRAQNNPGSTAPQTRTLNPNPTPTLHPHPPQFETMIRSEQIKEFRCFYDPAGLRFHSVVVLGKEVCGYPATVHGGLTAAIIDETLGGLYTALLTSGNLGLRMPGACFERVCGGGAMGTIPFRIPHL
jgi:hypothetical protein